MRSCEWSGGGDGDHVVAERRASVGHYKEKKVRRSELKEHYSCTTGMMRALQVHCRDYEGITGALQLHYRHDEGITGELQVLCVHYRCTTAALQA